MKKAVFNKLFLKMNGLAVRKREDGVGQDQNPSREKNLSLAEKDGTRRKV